MRALRNKKGETLVEIIVSITIFVMLFASIATLLNTANKLIIEPISTRKNFNALVDTYNLAGGTEANSDIHEGAIQIKFDMTDGLNTTHVTVDMAPKVLVSKTYQLLVEMRDEPN